MAGAQWECTVPTVLWEKSQRASQGDLWPPKGCPSDGQFMPGLSKTACLNPQKHEHQVT